MDDLFDLGDEFGDDSIQDEDETLTLDDQHERIEDEEAVSETPSFTPEPEPELKPDFTGDPVLATVVSIADVHANSTRVGNYWDLDRNIHANWSEALDRVQEVVDHCNEIEADLLVIAGDAFDNGRPAAELVALLTGIFAQLKTAKVVLLDGNHDQSGVVLDHRTPIGAYLEPHPWCIAAAATTELVTYDGIDLALIPWHRVAGTNSLSDDASALHDDIKRMADKVTNPSLLYGHLTVTEAGFNSGNRGSEMMMSTSVLEATVPTAVIEDGPWSAALLGHIHKAQQLGPKTRYLGSIYKVSFGEAEEEKTFRVTKVHQSGKLEEYTRKLNTRELVTLDLSEARNISRELVHAAETLKIFDILRVTLPSTDSMTSKQWDAVREVESRGVEVQLVHLPPPQTDSIRKVIDLDTSPRRAMEIYVKDNVDEASKLKKVMDTFDDISHVAFEEIG